MKQIDAVMYVIGLSITCRAIISYDVILNDKYTQNTKDIATVRVIIIN